MIRPSEVLILLVGLATTIIARDQDLFLSGNWQWKFFQAIFNERRNIVTSPFTLHMGMTLMASTVNDRYTLRQMRDKLHLEENMAKTIELYRRQLSILSRNEALAFGTKAFAIGTDEFSPAFESGAYNLNASIQRDPWMDTARLINDANEWAKLTTSGRIDSILLPRDLNPNTRFILLNAIAFRGEWENQFDVANSRQEKFHATGDSKFYMAKMMRLQQTLFPMAVYEPLKSLALELPFRDDDFSMVLILPQMGVNLTQLVGNLNQTSFRELYSSLTPTKIAVKIPRISIRNTVNVNAIFRKLQLTAPFEWSVFQVFKNERLSLDKVKHSVSLEVDEKGVRAAAVSAVSMVIRSEAPSFSADRPFVYAVIKKSQQFPLFIGNYAFPIGETPLPV
ncbi:serpin B8-like [Toxorhynchites rutilus septentrionalis]|uniref:serpin B8-like n=1 Tax=Toxorhynchites rutilus septentrionalis TaxID=329112 RepID=UPI002479E608|nr:serpin B8-like [Toxorhynchites rutilus septentrionalis]